MIRSVLSNYREHAAPKKETPECWYSAGRPTGNLFEFRTGHFRQAPLANTAIAAVRADANVQIFTKSSGWRDALFAADIEIRKHTVIADSAKQMLREMQAESRQEGFPEPSLKSAINAQYMLEYFNRRLLPSEADVYSTSDGEIAISISGGYRRGLLLLFGADGSALIMLTIDGIHRRVYYDNPPRKLDGFLQDALHDLNRASITSA